MCENDWRKETIKSVIDSAIYVIERSRYVFVVLNISGICIFSGLFNSIFPWIRNTIHREEMMKALGGQDTAYHLPHLEKTLAQDLWTVTAPLIGIKISVWDLSLIGTLSLTIIAVWQYYAIRRENEVIHLICCKAISASKSEPELAQYLYHGIVHYFLFTTSLIDNETTDSYPRIHSKYFIRCLQYLPVWLPILLVASDLFTTFVPFSASMHPDKTVWSALENKEKIEILIRTNISAIFICYSFLLCRKAVYYDKQTKDSIDKMRFET